MDRFTDAMLNVLAPPPVAPIAPATAPTESLRSQSTVNVFGTPRHRRQLALSQIENEPMLSVEDQLDLIEMFERDATLVDSYLGFTKVELRESWIMRKLAMHHH